MKPWEPQPKESMPAYAAFTEYRDLGSERSLEAVRRKVGKSKALMERWSSRWEWVKRVQLFDAHLDAIRVAAREQSITKQARKILSPDEVLTGLSFIAEADIAEVFEADGSFDLKAAKERGVSRLIKSIKFDKDSGKVVHIELHNAHGGFQDMGKHHKLFTDKVENSGSLKVEDASERTHEERATRILKLVAFRKAS